MEGFWIQVYISRRHLFVKVCQWAKYLGLLEVLWKFLKDNSLRFLWYSKNQKFSPLNPHSSRVSFPLCTFLRSFWIFQTVFENNWSDSCGIQRIQTLLPFWIHILTEVLSFFVLFSVAFEYFRLSAASYSCLFRASGSLLNFPNTFPTPQPLAYIFVPS